ncbi:unnamed protein product [Caenorhabditis brenneri]
MPSTSNVFKYTADVVQEKLDPEIPRPVWEYGIHITIRSAQCGTFIGSMLGPMALLLTQKEKNRQNIMDSFVMGGQAGAVIGTALGPVLTCMKLRGLCDLILYGKCYSLRFDEDALRRDRAAVFSAAVGYLSSGVPGFVIGLDVSFLLSKLVNYFH